MRAEMKENICILGFRCGQTMQGYWNECTRYDGRPKMPMTESEIHTMTAMQEGGKEEEKKRKKEKTSRSIIESASNYHPNSPPPGASVQNQMQFQRWQTQLFEPKHPVEEGMPSAHDSPPFAAG